MSNQIISFDFHNSKIRTICKNGEVFFYLSDVTSVLNLTNSRQIAKQIKDEFKLCNLNLHSFDTGYGVKQFTIITEPELYFVIFRSRSPIARDFRIWVFSEVLPSLRKTGSYEISKAKPERRDPEFVTLIRDPFSGIGENDRLRVIVSRNIWFCLDDVGAALGIHKMSSIYKQLDPAELRYLSFGKDENLLFGQILNFMRLAYHLKTIPATDYQRWIFSDALPKIQQIQNQYTFKYNELYKPELLTHDTQVSKEDLNAVVQNTDNKQELTHQEEKIASSPEPVKPQPLVIIKKRKVIDREERARKLLDEDLLYVVKHMDQESYKCGILTAILLSDPKNEYEKNAKEKLKRVLNIKPLQVRTEFMRGYTEGFKDMHDHTKE